MIVVKIKGGLGNQMFQYAFGRFLSIKKNEKLLLDVITRPDSYGRQFALDCFDIKADLADQRKIKLLNYMRKYRFVGSFSRKYFSFLAWEFIDENNYSLKIDCPGCKETNKYIDGYWQSEGYFKDIRDTILKDFTIKKSLSEKNFEIANKISETNSISIHVRRCDYVNDSETNKIHGTCDVGYYLEAVSLLKNKVSDPHFFIFSDDPDWAMENIVFDGKKEYVKHNIGNDSCFDIYLMSLCKHNIIANSSFSWWGAWLNRNKEKIVVAPKRWFADKDMNDKYSVVPTEWIKI
jgi:hypothetical protein